MFLLPCSSSPLSSKPLVFLFFCSTLGPCAGCSIQSLSERKLMCCCDCEHSNSVFRCRRRETLPCSFKLFLLGDRRSPGILTQRRKVPHFFQIKMQKKMPGIASLLQTLCCQAGRTISHLQRGPVFVIFIPPLGCEEEEERKEEQQDGETHHPKCDLYDRLA